MLFGALFVVLEGSWSVFGELAHYGASKEDIVLYLCIGSGAALVFGSLLGMISDLRYMNLVTFIYIVKWRSYRDLLMLDWTKVLSLVLFFFVGLFCLIRLMMFSLLL